MVFQRQQWWKQRTDPPQHPHHHTFPTVPPMLPPISSRLHNADTVSENSSGAWRGWTTSPAFSSWATFPRYCSSARALLWLQPSVFCSCQRAEHRGQLSRSGESWRCSNGTTEMSARQHQLLPVETSHQNTFQVCWQNNMKKIRKEYIIWVYLSLSQTQKPQHINPTSMSCHPLNIPRNALTHKKIVFKML